MKKFYILSLFILNQIFCADILRQELTNYLKPEEYNLSRSHKLVRMYDKFVSCIDFNNIQPHQLDDVDRTLTNLQIHCEKLSMDEQCKLSSLGLGGLYIKIKQDAIQKYKESILRTHPVHIVIKKETAVSVPSLRESDSFDARKSILETTLNHILQKPVLIDALLNRIVRNSVLMGDGFAHAYILRDFKVDEKDIANLESIKVKFLNKILPNLAPTTNLQALFERDKLRTRFAQRHGIIIGEYKKQIERESANSKEEIILAS